MADFQLTNVRVWILGVFLFWSWVLVEPIFLLGYLLVEETSLDTPVFLFAFDFCPTVARALVFLQSLLDRTRQSLERCNSWVGRLLRARQLLKRWHCCMFHSSCALLSLEHWNSCIICLLRALQGFEHWYSCKARSIGVQQLLVHWRLVPRMFLSFLWLFCPLTIFWTNLISSFW